MSGNGIKSIGPSFPPHDDALSITEQQLICLASATLKYILSTIIEIASSSQSPASSSSSFSSYPLVQLLPLEYSTLFNKLIAQLTGACEYFHSTCCLGGKPECFWKRNVFDQKGEIFVKGRSVNHKTTKSRRTFPLLVVEQVLLVTLKSHPTMCTILFTRDNCSAITS